MAKLPSYKQSQLFMEKPPTLQISSAPYINAANSMNQAIDKLQNVLEPVMKQNAIDAALDFNIENPLTLDQLKEAKQSGENPIEAYQNGGMIYNEVLEKTYAQQAATQLSLVDQTNNEKVLAEVTAGRLKDLDQIKEQLTSGIKGNARVLSTMNPEVANSYTKTSAAYGHTYFKAATKEITKQAELEQQLISEKTYVAAESRWENALDNITDPTELKEFKEIILASSLDQFRLTGKPNENLKALRKRLDSSEVQKIAQVAAKEHYSDLGWDTDAVMNGLIIEESIGRHTNWYRDLNPDKQKTFRTAIKANMQNLMLGDSASKAGRTKKFTGINARLDNLEIVSSDDFNKLPVIIDRNDVNYNRKDFLLKKQEDVAQALNLSDDDFTSYITEETKDFDYEAGLTQDQSDRIAYLEKFKLAMQERDLKAPVEAMLEHPSFKGREIINIDPAEFGNPAYVKDLKQEIEQRKVDMGVYAGHRNLTTDQLFTVAEINDLVDTWTAGSNGEKVALSSFIVSSFPDNAHEIFEDIQPKSSVFSQIGYLTLNSIQNEADPVYMEMVTNHILQGMEIDKLKVQPYAMGIDKTAGITEGLSNAFDNNPDLKSQVIKTADYIYYSLNQANADKFNTEDYNEALQMASGQIEKEVLIPDPYNVVDGKEQLMTSGKEMYGGIAVHNGQRLAIPTSIKQKTFSEMIEAATLEDFNMALSDRNGNLYNFAPTDEAPQFTQDQYQEAQLEFVNDTTASLSQGTTNWFSSLAEFSDLETQPMYSPFENQGTRLYINFKELHRIMNDRFPGIY